MSLTHSERLHLPFAQAFASASNVTQYAAFARSRDAVLERRAPGPLAAGEQWRLHRNGKVQEITVADCDPPRGLGFETLSRGVQITLGLSFEDGARPGERVQLTVDVEAVPRGLKGRLALAPLLLAKPRAQERLAKTVRKLAQSWAHDYARAVGE